MRKPILKEIRQRLPVFSKRQRQIADFILANHEDAALLTATQLAERSETSEPTVVRFSAGLGFARYADMQAALRELLKNKLSQIERFERNTEEETAGDVMATVNRFMRTDMVSIEKTLAGLHENELVSTAAAIANARRVYVMGSRSAYGLAYYFAHSLSWVRDGILPLDGSQNMSFDTLATSSNEDAAIAISLPPYPVSTVAMLRLASDNGTKTIAVTDAQASPLAQIADLALIVGNEPISLVDSPAPVMSLLTALLELVSGRNPEGTARHLEQLSAFWRKSGVYCDTEMPGSQDKKKLFGP